MATTGVRPRGLALLVLAALTGAALAILFLPRSACSHDACPDISAPPVALKVDFAPTTFAKLAGWAEDDHAAALAAFRQSCKAIAADASRFADHEGFGSPEAWAAACGEALTASDAKSFFESRFEPVVLAGREGRSGRVTGYYEPELKGSRTRSDAYPAAALARPDDLITADPVAFRPILRGERLSGKVVDGMLVPYESRAEIEAGSLGRRATALLYLASAADAFFLQIQGSGRIALAEGGQVRLAYAAQNGRPYTAIGAALIARGEIASGDMSMQAIRAWLDSHPGEAAEVMNLNESYVFFREQPLPDPSVGPDGAEGVPVTPGRSIAVDDGVYPYGVPLFVTARIGAADGTGQEEVRRLMIAQDTGGAIRGVVRADYFFGWGPEAERRAGATNGALRIVLLRPKSA
ncbi:MAG: murein transglycosylase A [Alphaproteobacteria bacterium]|nr:murein transglycosylase A [Alphaproteobacteria bacterium]